MNITISEKRFPKWEEFQKSTDFSEIFASAYHKWERRVEYEKQENEKRERRKKLEKRIKDYRLPDSIASGYTCMEKDPYGLYCRYVSKATYGKLYGQFERIELTVNFKADGTVDNYHLELPCDEGYYGDNSVICKRESTLVRKLVTIVLMSPQKWLKDRS